MHLAAARVVRDVKSRRPGWLAAAALTAALSSCEGAPREPAAGFDLEETTIAEVHEAYRRGQLSSAELTRAYLARIEQLDTGEDGLHAVITVQPGAVALAEQLDQRLARTGTLVGPLHGIPILVEDNLDTFDLPTSAGVLALAESVPPDDAFVVQRLRAAGAIILGKTNMMELAAFGSASLSSAGGTTRNAYDRSRSSLGSSGGSAVAVAANLATAAVGTDSNASIAAPAAANGVVAMRPSFGLVSRDGVVTGLDDTTVVGPVARTVEDAALLLSVMRGEDSADPSTRGAATYGGPVRFEGDALSGARIALVRELGSSFSFGGTSVEPPEGAKQLVIRALGAMRAAGARVSGVSIAAIDKQVTPLLARRHEDTPFGYHFDAYLATRGPAAPVHSLDEIVASGQMLPELIELVESSRRSSSRRPESDAQADVARGRSLLRSELLALMDREELDALVYLSIANPAQELGSLADDPYGNASQLSAFSGLPSLTVPMGTMRGLPLGLTLMGRPFRDEELLRLAYSFEQQTHYREPPPLD